MPTPECPPVEYLAALNRDWPDWPRKCRAVFEELRARHRIPSWCQMSAAAPMFAMTQDGRIPFNDIARLTSIPSIYLWRMTKGVYRFSPELYESLTSQPLDGAIPCAVLRRLPEWAVYIETPDMRFGESEIHGFIASLEYDYTGMVKSHEILRVLVFPAAGKPVAHEIPIPHPQSALDDMLDAANDAARFGEAMLGFQSRSGDAKAARGRFVPIMQLLLYLCSEAPDMPAIQHPRERMRASGAVDAPKEARVWDVGVRIGAAIRRYNNTPRENTGDGTHASPRPHVRRAHWHHFWAGPLEGTRELVLRWLPPIPVGMRWEDEGPVVIHPV